jgi:hypothetical protein
VASISELLERRREHGGVAERLFRMHLEAAWKIDCMLWSCVLIYDDAFGVLSQW